MYLVGAHDLGSVPVLVAEHYLDTAVRILNDMEVGEHMAAFVENEPRALALLRHRALKKVENQCFRGDVDYRRQHALVDGDVVLLFSVVGGRGFSFGELERRIAAVGTRQREMTQTIGKMGGDKPKPTHKQHNQNNPAQFHSC